jgi:DNA-directed RNA polymerase subunit beta'
MLKTTLGQLLVNEALPEEMRDYTRVLDKEGMKQLLRDIQERHPDDYRQITKRLMDVGRDAAYTTGGSSFGLKHLRTGKAAKASRLRLNRRIRDVMSRPWSDDKKDEKIVEATAVEHERLTQEILEEAEATGNPLADQVRSGSRGNAAQLKRLTGGDLLYMDQRDRAVPIPVQRSYSEGLSPAEYWAGTFGARKGLIEGKFATQDAGFFAKQLGQLAHRLIVTAEDADDTATDTLRGFPVDTDDTDNSGALLAADFGDYPRNTTLTPKILKDLRASGIQKILVRSPAVGGPSLGGVSARDVGVRERGGLSPLGDTVGLSAAQSLSERLTQSQLGSKHSGGLKGAAQSVSGFDYLNQLVQVPKRFKGGAAHAQVDGRVHAVREAPAGGHVIMVGSEEHFVAPGFEPKVKIGDTIEAGDVLSDGLPNPSEIVKHKGIGEGRRYFTQAFTQAYRDSGMPAHRRNVELIARGLIDHVEMLDEADDYLPGDITSYSALEKSWTPRQGVERVTPKKAVGRYLERPVLHFSIGTKVRPSMLQQFKDFGVKEVSAHRDPPPFQPVMQRAMGISQHDPDAFVRLLGSGQKRSLLGAVHRGGSSDTKSTSFVPSLMEGKSFGKDWPKSILTPSAIPVATPQLSLTPEKL